MVNAWDCLVAIQLISNPPVLKLVSVGLYKGKLTTFVPADSNCLTPSRRIEL
jgi:hypothetical protein